LITSAGPGNMAPRAEHTAEEAAAHGSGMVAGQTATISNITGNNVPGPWDITRRGIEMVKLTNRTVAFLGPSC
jgi:hypothetical protein